MESGAGEGSLKRKASQALERPGRSVRRSATPGASSSAVILPSTPPNPTQAECSGSTAVLPFRDVAGEDRPGTQETPTQTKRKRPSKTYSTAFRLKGIPADYSEKHILETFRKAVGSDVGVAVCSLASDPFRPGEKIATFESSNIPDEIYAAAAKDGWNLEAGPRKASGRVGRKPQMVMDSYFYGFTPLHFLEDDKCTFDIVAISGLGGHPFGSFKQRGKNFMWLRDGLPFDIDAARVFIYGYDTELAGSTSFKSIKDIELNLLTDIKKIRSSVDSNNQRPLMLIGHSLGGIITKEAIIQMSADSPDHDILKSIRGILFFGVPNQGMHIKSLIPMVGDQPNRYLVETLRRSSERLEIQATQFQKIFATHGSEIISFYETALSPTVENKDGEWQRTGTPAVLVDRASAIYMGYRGNNGQSIYAVNRTHSDMVKFPNKYDTTYEAVVFHLKRLKEKTDYSKSPLQELSADQLDCLRSLAITEKVRRLDQIALANDTCDWLVKHESYLEWLSQPRGMLWIKGKPGAGKSSLMKHILGVLERLYADEGAFIASFFVYGQGEQMQRSTQGLLQSLLHQLYPGFPALPALQALTDTFKRRNKAIGQHGEKWSWSARELEDALKSVLEQAPQSRPLVILVDALDELDAEAARDVIDSFQSIVRRLEKSSSLRICFACRHYPTLTLDECLKVVVEEGNYRDIRTVIERKLQSIPNRHDLVASILEKTNGIFQWADLVATHIRQEHLKGTPPTMLEEVVKGFPGDLHALYSRLLQESPEDRVQTVRLFQWVCFARRPLSVSELLHAVIVDAGTSPGPLKSRKPSQWFESSEKQIELKLRHLSKGLIEFSKKGDAANFGIVGYFIHQSVADYLIRRGFGELDCSLVTNPVERGHLQLAKACIQYFNLFEIEIIIREFWRLRPDMSRFSDGAIPHLISRTSPLLLYSLKYWTSHGKLAEDLEDGPDSLLKVFIWSAESATSTWEIMRVLRVDPEQSSTLIFSTIGRMFVVWRSLDVIYRDENHWWPSSIENNFCDVWLLSSFSGYKNVSYLDTHTIVQFFASGGMWRTLDLLRRRKNLDLGSTAWSHAAPQPLLIAVERGQIDMVKFLMRFLEVDVNCMHNHQSTPIQIAASQGHSEIVDILLTRRDIDPDWRGENGQTPFIVARNVDIAQRLLNTKRVEPSAATDDGQTALHFAARTGNLALCRFLIDTCNISLNAKDRPGRTAFAEGIAHRWGRSTEASKLMEFFLATAGVDPDTRDYEGWTPLNEAIVNRYATDKSQNVGQDVWMVQLLLRDGRADPDSRDVFGKSVLSHAAEGGNAQAVQLLLSTGRVDLDSRDTRWSSSSLFDPGGNSEGTTSDTPLHYASWTGTGESMRLLLGTGTSSLINTKGNSEDTTGYTPLHYSSWAGSVESVRLLLGTGKVDPDMRSLSGRTPLSVAAARGHGAVVHALLGTGRVDPDSRDAQYRSPLSVAAARGHGAVVQALLGTGRVDPDSRDAQYRSPLSHVLELGRNDTGVTAVIQLLLDTGKVDLDSKDIIGRTPTSYAASSGHPRSLQQLLSRDFDFDLTSKDINGVSPVEYAEGRYRDMQKWGWNKESEGMIHCEFKKAEGVLKTLQERVKRMKDH